jgi:type II secretory pathway pseudopilin PulG
MSLRAKKEHRRCGYTLLEVIVAAGAGTIVFGLALGVLLTTSRMVDQGIAHEAALQQAQLAMKEVRAVIGATVWPEDMATAPSGNAPVAFTSSSLVLFSTRHAPAGGLADFAFGNILNLSQTGEKRWSAGYDRKDAGSPSGAKFNAFSSKYESTIEFRYATQVGPDLKPVWQNSLPATERPRLIWVELVMIDREPEKRGGRPEEVRLQTAISL